MVKSGGDIVLKPIEKTDANQKHFYLDNKEKGFLNS